MTSRTFTVVTEDCSPKEVTSDGKVVRSEWTHSYGDKKMFMQLEEVGDDFIYSWSHGQGKGRVRIPSHIMFDLPELFEILNASRDNRLCGTTKIFEAQPIATLYARSK